MAQGEFTKEETVFIILTVKEIYAALSKAKQLGYAGQFNDIMLFLEAAERAAPEASKNQQRLVSKNSSR